MKTAKALAAGVAGFLAPAAALVIVHDGHMSGSDWIVAGATAVVAYAATWAAPKNKPAGEQ
jgi:hypothetical protein